MDDQPDDTYEDRHGRKICPMPRIPEPAEDGVNVCCGYAPLTQLLLVVRRTPAWSTVLPKQAFLYMMKGAVGVLAVFEPVVEDELTDHPLWIWRIPIVKYAWEANRLEVLRNLVELLIAGEISHAHLEERNWGHPTRVLLSAGDRE